MKLEKRNRTAALAYHIHREPLNLPMGVSQHFSYLILSTGMADKGLGPKEVVSLS